MIRFELKSIHAGWVDVEVSDETKSCVVTGSYLSDCLHNLVDAVQSLQSTSTAKCEWEQEPGTVAWNFARSGDDVELVLKDGGELLLSSSGNWRFFGLQLLNSMERTLERLGAEAYEKAWGYPFPAEACAKLRNAVRANSV